MKAFEEWWKTEREPGTYKYDWAAKAAWKAALKWAMDAINESDSRQIWTAMNKELNDTPQDGSEEKRNGL